MAKICSKKKVRLIVGDTEFLITTPIARVQPLKDLLFDLGASSICDGTFNLSKQQFSEFASKSMSI